MFQNCKQFRQIFFVTEEAKAHMQCPFRKKKLHYATEIRL